MAPKPIEIALNDEMATKRFGQDLALALQPGDCLALYGELGAGKSTLARAIIRCVAGDPSLDVPSPTFTLVQSYDLRIPISHFDLYRITDPDELDELGLSDALEEGAALVEWPERARGELSGNAVFVRLEEQGDGRRATVSGLQETMERFRRSVSIRSFLDQSGFAGADRHYLTGDASSRAYEAIETEKKGRHVLMNAPERLIGPVLKDGKRYAEIAHVAENVRPFVAIGGLLDRLGFSTPEIRAQDLEAGLLLLEDFGNEGMLDGEAKPVVQRWETAIDCLAALHRGRIPAALPLPGGAHHIIPPFDRDAMMIEVELLPEWYLPYLQGSSPTDAFRQRFSACWNALIDRLKNAEQSLVLRDFHSPNLLWQADRQGIRQVGLIDFQDAMIGPAAYDVASLVQDARVTVPPALCEHLVARYRAARNGDADFDALAFDEALAIMQAQRATKLLGLFVRLKNRDGKPGYVSHLPRIETYLRTSLRHPVLHPLHDCYKDVGIALDES